MVALMSKGKDGTLIPLNVSERLGFLLLPAQYLEALEVEYYFQLGINLEYFNVESPPV